jgi:hypothetical protein
MKKSKDIIQSKSKKSKEMCSDCKNGFVYLFKDEEQEAVSSKMNLPLKTRYMHFDLIGIIEK